MTRTYAVVDVETTGGRAEAERVIEVAVVTVERGRVTDRWRTFLRPERPIPFWISRLTGITDDHVRDAPTFDLVANDLLRRLQGRVFVAHNASFDSRFLCAEFARLGRAWGPEILCTVKLGRALVPGLHGYSLDALTDHFEIEVVDRHRALGDADATAILLLKLLKRAGAKEAVAKQLSRPVALPPGTDSLPPGPGVWILRDAAGTILRSGASPQLAFNFRQAYITLPKKTRAATATVEPVPCASEIEAQVLQASMEPPPAEPEHPFLVVTPAGHLEAGPTAPGRVFGPFRSMRELRGRMKAAEGLPLEEAITRITRGIGPLGLLRRAGPPPGPGHLVRQGERLLWIQHDRLRKAWTIGADDESQIRDEIRSLLERPFDPATAPRVRAKRGTPVEDFLR